MGKPLKIKKLKRELNIKHHSNYSIADKQYGEELSAKDYLDFLSLKPQRHPLHKMLLVYAENGKVRVVDSLTMTELYHFVIGKEKYLNITKNKTLLKKEDYIYIKYDFRELPLHKIVVEAYYNRIKDDEESTHHIDFNKHNNNATNLILIRHDDHVRLHKLNRK